MDSSESSDRSAYVGNAPKSDSGVRGSAGSGAGSVKSYAFAAGVYYSVYKAEYDGDKGNCWKYIYC